MPNTTATPPTDRLPATDLDPDTATDSAATVGNEGAPEGAKDHTFPELSLKLKLVNLVAVVLPFIGFLAAFVLLWGVAFNWIYLGLLVAMYSITAVGITVGFHRLFTHRSFECPGWVRMLFGIFGSMAVQGPVIEWVADHRRHHQHSDVDGDPHSPHHHGDTVAGVIRGAFHSHVGWLFRGRPKNSVRYVRDLLEDPLVRFVNRHFVLWVALGLLIPAAIGGLVTMSWTGVLLGFLWGGLARVFLVHHVTWSINSVCHIWGTRDFRSHDESRNNVIFGVLAFGEGWHNNHHAFPTSARHGLRWWEIDLSYLLIRAMEKVGLARNVRVPTAERQQSKRLQPKRRQPEKNAGA